MRHRNRASLQKRIGTSRQVKLIASVTQNRDTEQQRCRQLRHVTHNWRCKQLVEKSSYKHVPTSTISLCINSSSKHSRGLSCSTTAPKPPNNLYKLLYKRSRMSLRQISAGWTKPRLLIRKSSPNCQQ